ncbi:MAG TPA: hypothetical protein VMZ52_10915 [Bryobacteraceae bacterium]|nr:hypothetical protein [Bryobacteraceae bacterium]
MARKILLAAILTCALLPAQMKMSVDQLRSFIQSSRQLGHPDKKVADYLKQVKLTYRLEERDVEDIQGLGAGPKTLEVLHEMVNGSKNLPVAPAPPPKAAPKPLPPPSSMEQGKILQEVTEYAREYAKNLPNFICTQVTRRYVDPTGLEFWRQSDVVTAKLSYFEQKEDYKVVLVNNQMVDTTMERLGGATSSGEFGSMLRQIFDPHSQAQFDWDHWGRLRGKPMYVFSYRVAQARSQWRIVYDKTMSIIPGYRGLIYVDKDTHAVMRVVLEGEDIPVSFPVQQASTTLDYDFIDISGKEYVLPLKATVRMRSGKVLIKNDTEFRLYKKFGAEATITFTPDALPEEKEQK